MLTNAARYSCSEANFGEEIQQLGLPKDHAAAMCRVLQTHAAAIRQKLIDKSFRSECCILHYIVFPFVIHIVLLFQLMSCRAYAT